MRIRGILSSVGTIAQNALTQVPAQDAQPKPSSNSSPQQTQESATLQHLNAHLQQRQPSQVNLAFSLPPNKERLDRRDLAYKIAEKVFSHNGIPVSRAALEEVAADLQKMERMDINGKLRGNWVDPQIIPQANGKPVQGYWFTLSPEFQQHVLDTYTDQALQVTQAGTQPVTGARMQERMTRAIGLSYEKYMTPELKAALGENATPERIATLVGVAGAAGILAKTPARGALGVAGAGLAVHEGIQTYIKWDDFLKACAEAKSPSELDTAAREFAKLTAQLGVDGVAALVGSASAKAAPKIAGKVNDVAQAGVNAVSNKLPRPPASVREAVTTYGVRIRMPVDDEALRARPFQMAAGRVPDVDHTGRPYTPEQKQRIRELGDDPDRGLLPHEGEAGLAAEETHSLKLQRYKDRGLEFTDESGNYWDVVSPMSIGHDGKPAFRLDQVLKNIKRHFLKGDVILDFGRLNKTDAAALKNSVGTLTDTDKRGRQIIFVRDGG